jgi:hypothetical protein
MKKMFKLFMCAAVIAVGFTACSETEVIPGPNGGGDDTQSGLLTINFTQPTTYAADGNAIASENAVRDVTILVYNSQGICKVDTTIAVGSLTDLTNNAYKAANIRVPLGVHSVYAGINLTTGDANKMMGVLASSTVSKVPGVLNGGTYGYLNFVNLGTATAPDFNEIKKLYAPNAFPMFSVEEKMFDIQPTLPSGEIPAANKISISLERMVAKVTVRKGTEFDKANKSDNFHAAGATFSDAGVTWTIGQLNGKIYPYGKANNGHDPNYDNAPASLKGTDGEKYRNENFVNNFVTKGKTDYKDWTWDQDALAIDDNSVVVGTRKPKYAPENNSKLTSPRLGESTFSAIRVKFAPDKVLEFKNGDTAPKEVATYVPNLGKDDTYYVVSSDYIYYFSSESDAKLFRDFLVGQNPNKPVKLKTYYGQYCFYHLMMGKGETKRNNYYDITLNKFTGLGTPTGEIDEDDVDKTVDDTGLLDVTIDIKAWTVVNEDYPLEN